MAPNDPSFQRVQKTTWIPGMAKRRNTSFALQLDALGKNSMGIRWPLQHYKAIDDGDLAWSSYKGKE